MSEPRWSIRLPSLSALNYALETLHGLTASLAHELQLIKFKLWRIKHSPVDESQLGSSQLRSSAVSLGLSLVLAPPHSELSDHGPERIGAYLEHNGWSIASLQRGDQLSELASPSSLIAEFHSAPSAVRRVELELLCPASEILEGALKAAQIKDIQPVNAQLSHRGETKRLWLEIEPTDHHFVQWAQGASEIGSILATSQPHRSRSSEGYRPTVWPLTQPPRGWSLPTRSSFETPLNPPLKVSRALSLVKRDLRLVSREDTDLFIFDGQEADALIKLVKRLPEDHKRWLSFNLFHIYELSIKHSLPSFLIAVSYRTPQLLPSRARQQLSEWLYELMPLDHFRKITSLPSIYLSQSLEIQGALQKEELKAALLQSSLTSTNRPHLSSFILITSFFSAETHPRLDVPHLAARAFHVSTQFEIDGDGPIELISASARSQLSRWMQRVTLEFHPQQLQSISDSSLNTTPET